MFDSASLKKMFKHAAATYEAASVNYREIADRLLESLDWVRLTPTSVVDLGSGTGYVTRLLKKRYPYAEIMAVDWVEEMLVASKATPQWQRQDNTLICANAAQLPLSDNSLDLVVSNLMLPWCADPEVIFKEVRRVLKPSGLFLFATFGPDTLGELRASWTKVDEMPHVHLFFDLHDIGDALVRAGFSDPVMQTEWLTILYKDMHDLWQDLKRTGSTNILSERRKTWVGKNRVAQFLAEYDTYRDKAGKLPATLEIVYGHCWKVERPFKKAIETSVPINEIIFRR